MITVALAGKPNAGKSTFYTASTMADVDVANYPFTTIDANRGVAAVRTRCPCLDRDRRVELTVTESGHPWGTYAATIGREAGHTAVTIEYTADKRFGLRRIPQQLLAARYRDEALNVQGYDVVDRTSRVGR